MHDVVLPFYAKYIIYKFYRKKEVHIHKHICKKTIRIINFESIQKKHK